MSAPTTLAHGEKGKELAGVQAAQLVESGMRLGLGTGSTVEYFLEALAERIQGGELTGVAGVPTSLRTQARAVELGIPLLELDSIPELDLTVDGADEVDPDLDLIKGLGGALFREKVVARASRRFVVVADVGKSVERLGTRAPLPVEVVPFGWTTHLPLFTALGAEPRRREAAPGEPYRTDNGNFVVDLAFPSGITDAAGVEEALTSRLGVVATGLFLGMADTVLLGGGEDVTVLTRGGGR